jgi:hypothetical protein
MLVLADVALVWSLPVLVGQDLPQHLSYARILADYADPSLPFHATFELPPHPQPYFTAYLVLAALTRVTSVMTACRLVYTGYVVATATGFAALVRAVHAPRTRTPWTALFGPLLVWNPVQCVGFLPFMLALPAVLFGAASVIHCTEGRARRPFLTLAFVAALTTSLHLVAAASLAVFAALYALFRRSARGALAASLTALASLGTLALWRAAGERELAELPEGSLAANVATEGLWGGLVRALGMRWSTLADRKTFIVATVLGPLTYEAKMAIGLAILGLVVVVWSARKERAPLADAAPSRLPYALAVLAFAALVVVTPTSLARPEDICLLDFRLYVLAFMLAVAAITPRALEPRRAHVGLGLFAAFVMVVWGRQLGGASGEAEAVVRLMNGLAPTDTVLALPFHDRSEYLDESNAVTHYFPVYNTALHGGVTSLFWGKFSRHLPVGYRAGHEPSRPPDWDSSQFTREELLATSHVLVEWPDEDDGDVRASGAARLRDELADGFAPVGCDGRWCLYRSPARRALTETEEALR